MPDTSKSTETKAQPAKAVANPDPSDAGPKRSQKQAGQSLRDPQKGNEDAK